MIETNYPIKALGLLLDTRCLSERYAPLIPHKAALIEGLQLRGCKTRKDAEALPDEDYLQMGLDVQSIPLLRRFFTLYDPNPQKFREIPKLCSDAEIQPILRELYHLPGVKYTRASLYLRAGFRSLADIADAGEEALLERTAQAIRTDGLGCTPPLPKEVRTHIAVARAFLLQDFI